MHNDLSHPYGPALTIPFFIGTILFLSLLSLASYIFGIYSVAFFLTPLPLLFLKNIKIAALILFFAGYIIFYQPQSAPGIHFFKIPEATLIVLLILLGLKKNKLFSFSLPISSLLLSLYCLVAYIMIMAIVRFSGTNHDYFFSRDMINTLFLLLVFIYARPSSLPPKSVVIILCSIAVFSALLSLYCIYTYINGAKRIMSWNETYISDSVLIALVLMRVVNKFRWRIVFISSLVVCILGLMTIQTRAIWLSTCICAALYLLVLLVIQKKIPWKTIFKTASVIILVLLGTSFILTMMTKKDAVNFVQDRMSSGTNNALINPSSSLGYRIYESSMVWKNRTFWGHGPGAKLYLFFTLSHNKKWTQWWGIHSGYFEMLHKYGFFGMGLFFIFVLIFLFRSFRMILYPKAFISSMGSISFFTLVNHLIISVTSGYLIRDNIVVFLVLIISIVENYYYRIQNTPAIPNNNILI